MKKLRIVFALLLMSFTLKAQLSQLNLRTYYNASFDLYLDGALLVSNVSEVNIQDITPGMHNLQLKKLNTYNSNAFGYYHKPVLTFFQGSINIPANTLITAMVYQGQLIIQNQTALMPVQTNNNYYGSNNSYPYGNGYPPNPNDPYNNVNPYQGQGYGQSSNYMPGMNTHWNVPAPQPAPACPIAQQPVYNYGPHAMTPESFQMLKSSIENQWFSSGQLDVFNQALATNFFTSNQVREIVQQFTFSSDQLTVAKKAYNKTVDPQNYFVVNDALEFSSSVNALTAYIASL